MVYASNSLASLISKNYINFIVNLDEKLMHFYKGFADVSLPNYVGFFLEFC